jgi:MFS family permease
VVFGLFAVAQGTGLLIVARLLQGIASTAVWLTAAVMVADWAPAGQGARLFGRYQVISVWGAAVGAIWSGIVLGLLDADTRTALDAALQSLSRQDLLAWVPAPWAALDVLHLVFAGNAVFALVALVGALRVPEPPRTPPPSSASTPARPFAAINVSGLFQGVAAGSLLPVVVLVIDDRFNVGSAGVGLVYAVPGIVYAVAPELLGRLADRWGYRTAATVGLLAVGVSYGVFPFAPTVVFAVLALCVEAIGMSLAAPALLALVGGGQAHRIGSAYGWYTTANVLGVAIGSPLGGWLYERALAAPFMVAAVCAVLAALALRHGVERRKSTLVLDHLP